ncbi:cell wall adhesin EAP1-like [Ceratitis capitata]|uniref:cell wall adhesin EAP1-like n=1 Tax=Ceratitis capitata TaxID=7213 RepID=UPI000329D94C|nr:cell wall adhesin EAP1-like [Ceratitis capitata]
MKYLVIFAAVLVCAQAVQLPYIVQTNSLESSEEEYRVVLPAKGQRPISLPGIGVINQPVAQAVKVKVPRFVTPEVKQQIITQALVARGISLQDLGTKPLDAGATSATPAAAKDVVRQLRQAQVGGGVVVVSGNVAPVKVPLVPAVAGVPAVPVVSGGAAVVPKSAGVPAATGVSVGSGVAVGSVVPGVSAVPVPGVPVVPVPVVPGVSAVPVPGKPVVPGVPVVPAVPGVPVGSVNPVAPVVPVAPDAPAVQGGAVVPNSPVVPAVPKVPVVPAVSTATKAPIAVLTPALAKSN